MLFLCPVYVDKEAILKQGGHTKQKQSSREHWLGSKRLSTWEGRTLVVRSWARGHVW